ncbi:GNAT family N-acetyltransferase [Paenibacillus sp. V4I3]|uniref:GNAT family N-acetyltransferase n=1 Tax=Paenibacillus sp. V4I3 TaxID=3042305 RepID=UPI0027D85B2E|nr:GNAT family N-acetyltransferase [Paenibacillus sp. V4I3]
MIAAITTMTAKAPIIATSREIPLSRFNGNPPAKVISSSPYHISPQKNGLGKLIIDHLLAYIKKCKYKNGIAFVGLFASHGNDKFYDKFGFKDYSPEMTGMFTVLDK